MKKGNNGDSNDKDKDKDKGKDKMKKKKVNPETAHELDKILKAALNNYLASQASEYKNKTKDIETMKVIIEEFLNSYILLGYLPSGEPVSIISAHNQQEADSLSALLNKFLLNQRGDDDKDMPF